MRADRYPNVQVSDTARLPEAREAFDRMAHLAAREGRGAAALLLERSDTGVRALGRAGLDAPLEALALDIARTLGPQEVWVGDTSREARWVPLDLGRGRRAIHHLHWLPLNRAPGAFLLLLDHQARDERRNEIGIGLVSEMAADLVLAMRHQRELVMAQVALQRRHQGQIELVERTAGLGSWSVETDGERVDCSAGLLSLLGLVPEAAPRTLEDLLAHHAPEWRQGLRQRLERCAASAEPFDEEVQVLIESSGPKWVRTVGAAVTDENGHPVRVQVTVHDISATKQAQQETLRLAMRLTTTLASITEAFVTLDRQCCFTYLNQESERLLQKTTADLLGVEVWHGFAPALAQRLKEHLGRALQTNRRVELEDWFASLGKWLEVRAYPFAEGLAVYFRDVTERRRSQEQLMLLETSVARLNDIVLIAETGAQDVRSEPKIVFVNDAFELHTGYSRAEVLGQSPGMLLDLDPAVSKLREISRGLRDTQKARTELMVRRKNGALFWVELEVVSVQPSADEVTHWVAVGRDITQRKTAEDMIRHLAFYDPLTDLPNRQLLLDKLQQALSVSARSGQHGALLFIDLDNFKILNDTLGHQMGDQLLKKVAQRLAASVRKTDLVARLGGDEFVVMADDLSPSPVAAAHKARVLANKVLQTLREPFALTGHQHFATPSIGVTIFHGTQADVGELLKQADLAMYQAKSMGRNTLCFFDPSLQAEMSENARTASDLRDGLRRREFVVHYQPQVDKAGMIIGVEALLRWNHPERGLLSPIAFIPVAEDTGLILPLGLWALETACGQLAAWSKRPETANLSIAVNVSVRQFRHPDFVDSVMACIRASGVKPQRLKLELTESLLADRMEITIEKMGMLKSLGVTLSLDDFGMGYSSLSLLKRLPLDQLKIDRAFVADVLTDPNDAAISRAIIALAQSLSLQVVAEGVETIEQRDFLAYQGCDQFQGHLFAKPLPIEALDALLSNPVSGMVVVG
jgi:diguanylate cyclase (GGDEF)-like protein/PAS domain S-box-containing protein